MANWIRHNHHHPCPVCGETKKGCRTNAQTNITHCRGDNPSPEYRFLKEDKHGFGMYRLESEIEAFSEARKQEWLEEKQRERERWLEAENQKIKDSLSNQERDRAIRAILSQLTLTTEDRERLQARGLTDKQIDDAGYRSVSQWQKLTNPVSPALAGINRVGRGLNNPVDGILIPVPNVHGQYVGLRLHDPNSEETGNGKYVWLSSNKQGCTQKDKQTGEYPVAVYYPSEIKEPNKVGICEGLEWKPKLAAERLGYPVIGFAGVSFFPLSPTLLKEALEALEAKTVTFLPDAGAVTNPRVIDPACELFRIIQNWDYDLSIAWWEQIEKSNGDIDEISLDTEINLISWDEFKQHFNFPESSDRDEREAGSKLISQEQWLAQKANEFWEWIKDQAQHQFNGFDEEAKQERINRTKRKVEATPLKYGDDPLPTPDQLEKLPPIEFKRSDRVPLIQELIQLGWEHILDKSHTGTGKSHEANLIKADEGKTFYIVTQHRNPSVSTAENKTDIPSRHQGLTLDHNRLTPNGNPYQHRWEYSPDTPQPDIAGNCHQADLFNNLHRKGYDIWGESSETEDGKTDNPICAGCSKRPTCLIGGYKAERQEAFKDDELRVHPDSLPDVSEKDILIWEEASQSLRATKELILKANDVEKAFNWIERYALESTAIAAVYQRLAPIKHKILDALSGKIKIPHYGAISYGEDENKLASLLGLEPYPELEGDLAIFSDIIDKHSGLSDKDLADFKDQRVDRDQMTQKERKRWKDTIDFANAQLFGETKRHNEETIKNLPSLGVDTFLSLLFGLGRGAARLRKGEIILTLPDNRHSNLAKSAKANLYLDATIAPEWLATKLGVEESAIAVIYQEKPELNNLTIHAIHNEGMSSRLYSDDCKRRTNAIINQIIEDADGDIATLAWKDSSDWLEAELKGWWFNHSRSTNELKGVPNLIAVGSPYTNYGAIADEYFCLKGSLDGFDEFYDRLRQDEIIQLIGRQRAHLYPDSDFHIYLIGSNLDFAFLEDMGIKVTYQEGLEVTPEAGKSRQQTIIRLTHLMMELGEEFFRFTQSAIAQRLEVSQKNISEILAKLDTGKGNWKDRLKILYRALYKRFIGNGINETSLKDSLFAVKELREWLQLPEWTGKNANEVIEGAIAELVRLLEAGEDISKKDEIYGLHPLAVVAIALEISPPPD